MAEVPSTPRQARLRANRSVRPGRSVASDSANEANPPIHPKVLAPIIHARPRLTVVPPQPGDETEIVNSEEQLPTSSVPRKDVESVSGVVPDVPRDEPERPITGEEAATTIVALFAQGEGFDEFAEIIEKYESLALPTLPDVIEVDDLPPAINRMGLAVARIHRLFDEDTVVYARANTASA
jgi:hypothetical protein